MKNILFDKKFAEDNQLSYLNGWQKALKTYEEVMEEDLRMKIGLKNLGSMKMMPEVKKV